MKAAAHADGFVRAANPWSARQWFLLLSGYARDVIIN